MKSTPRQGATSRTSSSLVRLTLTIPNDSRETRSSHEVQPQMNTDKHRPAATTESLVEEALGELKSDMCLCGARKKSGESFCRACYYALPPGLRHRLYLPLSEGYAAIWDQARDYLKQETNRIPAQPAAKQEKLPL